MSFKSPMKLVLPCIIALLLACGHQREQQRNIMKDLKLMQRAMVAQQEIPPPSEDPERYGKWGELVRFMFERLVKGAALNKEFLALAQETELWTSPAEWKDPQKVKVIRSKAERLVAVVDEYTLLIDETSGEMAMEKIRTFKFGSRFNEGFRRGMQEHSAMLDELNALMITTRNWARQMADLLTLVDEKLVKLDGNIPKFELIQDAERYRSLNYRIQQEKQLLGDQVVRYLKNYKEYRKSLEAKFDKATES